MNSDRDQFKLRRRRESVTAKEIIAWMRTKRSWQWAASINDINRALDEICQWSPSSDGQKSSNHLQDQSNQVKP